MSALTKTFIVVHVVLSLLLAAGLIVFVNRTENFKATIATQKNLVSRLQEESRSAKTDAEAWKTQTDQIRSARDAAIADAQKQALASANEVANLKTQIAADESNAKIATVTLDNLTAALTASETERKAQGDSLASARAEYDKAVGQVSQLNLAISDLTNRLDVSTRKLTDSLEQIAALRSSNDNMAKQLADAGVSPTAPAGVKAGAPPINGVVLSTNNQNGINLATINVGSNEQVKAGMEFQVIDRDKGNFLGVLTIETVDQQSATGKLEGPRITDVKAGNEVKTQL